MIDTTWVILRRYPAVIHAELAKSALQAYDVDAAVVGGTQSPTRIASTFH
jgi:hypothetical protein